MRKLYFLEAHSFWHFNISQLLFVIKWRWPLLAHRLAHHIAVYAILALALLWTFYPVRETRAIFLVAFCFLTSTEFTLPVLRCRSCFQGLHSFGPFLRVDFIPAILAFAKRSAHSVILEALAVWFQALAVLAITKLPLICHQQRIFHLNTGFTASVFEANFGSSIKAWALSPSAGWETITGVT